MKLIDKISHSKAYELADRMTSLLFALDPYNNDKETVVPASIKMMDDLFSNNVKEYIKYLQEFINEGLDYEQLKEAALLLVELIKIDQCGYKEEENHEL